MGRGQAKDFELINSDLAQSRDRYMELIMKPAQIEEQLHAGAQKARAFAGPFLQEIRHAVGIRPLSG